MNDTQITLQGGIGGRVDTRDAAGTPVASFRVASTPSRYSRKSEQWVDGDTQWYTVKAWRGLAENCTRSLAMGDPVIVHGRLESHSYVNGSGVQVLDLEVEATLVGHDLNRGTTRFERTPRREPGEFTQPAQPGDVAEPVAAAS